METPDYSIRELSRMTLALRDELTFTPQTSGGDTYYVIEDPINSKFHRVGLTEYTFISLLDGKTPLGDVLRMAARISPDSAFTEYEAAAICKWLVDARLAYTPESLQSVETMSQEQAAIAGGLQRFNPVSTKLPLICPDRFFTVLGRWLAWIHAPWAMAGWSVLVCYAVYLVASNWDRFSASSEGILAPGNWLGMGLSCLALKFLHEVSHGLACKRYGGSVREAGVMLILLMPIPYVDATSSWRFPSKWQRIQAAAAGMYLELMLASIAVICWSAAEESLFSQICYNVAIVGSALTLAVNANPLMRFDGYYIFSDLVEIPNLYSNGQEYVRCWARRHLLGVDATVSHWSRSRGWIIAAYGLLAVGWRVFVCAGLAISASVLLHGAGIVLSCLAVALWLGIPAVRFTRYLLDKDKPQRPNLTRFVATVGTGGLALCLCLLVVPWPGRVSAPAVVDYEPFTVVRASSAGFIRQLSVRGGQLVEQGQVLAILENKELAFELAELELACQQSDIRCRAYRRSGKMAEYQAECEQRLALTRKSQEKEAQVNQLVLKAPTRGKIIGRNLETLVGTYLDEGTEVLSIGDEANKALKMSIAQEDVDAFKTYVEQPVHIHCRSSPPLTSRLDKLDPQAERDPPHPALSAALGGPLAVRAKASGSDDSDDARGFELVNPRFTGTVALDPQTSVSLRGGQISLVTIRPFHESIGAHLYNTIARWIRNRVREQTSTDS